MRLDGAPRRRARRPHGDLPGIALIHQELNLADNLDVADNVLLGREPTGWGPLRLLDRRKMHAIVQPYLAQLGLSIQRTRPSPDCRSRRSSSSRSRRPSRSKARVLIMDEPTSSLTLAETKAARDRRWTARGGVGVVYISHRLAEVAVADRAVVLRDGANVG